MKGRRISGAEKNAGPSLPDGAGEFFDQLGNLARLACDDFLEVELWEKWSNDKSNMFFKG